MTLCTQIQAREVWLVQESRVFVPQGKKQWIKKVTPPANQCVTSRLPLPYEGMMWDDPQGHFFCAFILCFQGRKISNSQSIEDEYSVLLCWGEREKENEIPTNVLGYSEKFTTCQSWEEIFLLYSALTAHLMGI